MATDGKVPSKETVDLLYNGLVAFYPRSVFGDKKAETVGIKKSWNGMGSTDFALLVTNITQTQDVDEAAKQILSWKISYERGEYPNATIPENLDELVSSLDEEGKGQAEKARLAKEVLLESERAKEEGGIKVEEAEAPQEKAPAAPQSEEDPTAQTSPQQEAPSPSTEPAGPTSGPGIALEVVKSVDINPIAKATLKVATLPFFFAGPSVASTPEGHVTASAQNILFKHHITSNNFAAVRPKALSLGISPKEFDNLLKAIAEQERAFPGLYNRISSGFGVQEIVARAGVPQAVAGQLFLAPSSEAGSLVVPRRGLLGSFLGRAGQQLFGKIFKGFVSKKAAGSAVTKIASTVAKLEPHVRVVSWAVTAISAVVRFFKGKGDKDGIGGTIATIGLVAGGLALLPVVPVLGIGLLGVGGLTGIGTLANKAGGYGNLGAQGAGFGETLLTGLTSVVGPAITVPVVVALISVPLVIAIIIFIINSGAYIVPPSPTDLPGAIESPYIGIEKEASPERLETISGSQTITYSVRIFAKKGTLSNVRITNEYKVISSSNPQTPNPQVDEISNPPTIISPVEDYVFEYQISLDESYNDSIVVDSITVVADAPEQKDATARISASVVIGNPPIACPLPGQSVSPRHASYTPGVETGGHGSTDYWNRMAAPACDYPLPQGAPGCGYTNDPRAKESGNPCYSENGCSTYGYAIDVFGSPGQEVFLPTVNGQSVDWSYAGSFSNGTTGYSHKYRSRQYYLVLTHMGQSATEGNGIPSGTAIGRLHPQGGNTHVHIEFAEGGQYVRPEEYFCF